MKTDSWLGKLFDSTTKMIVWCILALCFYLVLRVIRGWENGLDGAPEIIATVFGVIVLITEGYLWKSKQENILKIAKSCGNEKQAVEQIINDSKQPDHDISTSHNFDESEVG